MSALEELFPFMTQRARRRGRKIDVARAYQAAAHAANPRRWIAIPVDIDRNMKVHSDRARQLQLLALAANCRKRMVKS